MGTRKTTIVMGPETEKRKKNGLNRIPKPLKW